ncbi:MAG: hypothetical protein K2H09_04215 [Treponemataceae bacterium]|nr:hypothetical protein [Treponemataceae bacterium]
MNNSIPSHTSNQPAADGSARWLESVYSDGSRWFVSNPLPAKGERITVALQLAADAPVSAVIFRTKKNGVERLEAMRAVQERDGLRRYEADVQIWEKELRYQFYLVTARCVYYYTEAGISTHIPDEGHDFRILTGYQQPEWVKGAVFYQIFPERFCNGNPANDVQDGEYTFDGHPAQRVADWNSVPARYAQSHCLDFYGGDLEGVRQKIPYLKRLGVTALYLNPIFYGATVHKYDCLDYFHVDPHFGGDDALAALAEELHKNGMKIILDVSINHTGIANRWFNRDGTFFSKSEGAFNNPDAPERGFYFFKPDNSYKAWFDVPTLPTLNYTSQALRARLYRDPDSLVKKWLKPPFCMDGWRFDVADTMARNDEIQLHHEVWPEIRRSIKEENPQAYILAEDWSDCAEFLNGDEWDSPMNYFGSSRPIRQFYGEPDLFNARCPELRAVPYRMTARDLSHRITEWLSRLPFAIRQVQFNLLDSHDVPRLHNNPAVPPEAVRGAVIMLFTLPGCASIYYGDEAGIGGRTDDNEGCRYPMPWDEDFESSGIWKLYAALSHIKAGNAAFADGGFKVVWDEDYVFAFARFSPEELWLTVCSADSCAREVSLPLDAFGTQFAARGVPAEDALGCALDARIDGGRLVLNVPAGASFLIRL